MPNLRQGLDFEEYLAACDMNVRTMRENFGETTIPPDDHDFFKRLGEKLPPGHITIVILTESWCGDCVENVPVVAKLASLYPVLRVSIFPRDTNLDIMEGYLTAGRMTIPVFAVIDGDGKELGRFVERPPGAHAFLKEAQENARNLPDRERKRAFYQARTDLRKLYREGLRDETIKAIRRIIETRYGSKNA